MRESEVKTVVRALVTATIVLPVAVACESPLAVERDTEPLLQTSALHFELEWAEVGYETTIPYTFTNETSGPVFLVNCNGNTPPMLEVKRNGEWVPG